MRLIGLRPAMVLCLCVHLSAVSASAWDETHQGRVQKALDEMHSWLAAADNGPAWHALLRSDELAGQLQRGDDADLVAVAEVLDIYASDINGLDCKRFVAVREALAAWRDELSIPSGDQLPEAARSVKESFVPVRPSDVAQAKSVLLKSIDALDRFLAKGGSEKEKSWKTFLRWQDLQAQLRGDGQPDLRVLQTVRSRFYSGASGLELARFADAKHALRDYMDAILFSTAPNASEQYAVQLEALAAGLESHAAEPSNQTAYEIGSRLGWLERARQCSGLIVAVRRRYSHPNLLVRVSERMIAAGINEDVEDKSPIEDYILGTTIYGTGRTKGRVTVELVSDSRHAALDLCLNGTTTSDTVGYNGPVTIYSNGSTRISGRKRLLIDAGGIKDLPATARCEVNSNISDIEARMKFIQRIAWKKAGRDQHRAERIASKHAQRKVSERMDRQADELLDTARKDFVEKFRDPLRRRDEFPQILNMRTSDQFLFVTLLQANAFQLAASGDPPAFTDGHDLDVCVHQSLINNFAEALLGGVTLTDEKLAQLAKDLTGQVPEQLQINPDIDPWSITFTAAQPITLDFAEGRLRIAIRGRRFTRSDRRINRAMEISATYTLEKTAQGAKLTRQGPVQVIYLVGRRRRQSAEQVAFRTFMRNKFEQVFKQELITKGLELPGRWKRAGKLSLGRLSADGGWLSLSWRQPTGGAVAAAGEQ